MRDAAEDAAEREALLAPVEERTAARSAADDEGLPLGSAAARALAELLHPGAPTSQVVGVDDGWRAVLGGVHQRAVALADGHPASWTLATSSAVLVDDWVAGGTWASALRGALERAGAGPAAVRDAPVVVALHLLAVRARGGELPGEEHPPEVLAAFPHVTRLRTLLSCAGPADEPGGPAAHDAALLAVERLLR